jgi:hypothetical protein
MYAKRYRLHILVSLILAVLLLLSWSAPDDVSGMGKSEATRLTQPDSSDSKVHKGPDRNRAATSSQQKLEIPDQVVIGILWLLSNY